MTFGWRWWRAPWVLGVVGIVTLAGAAHGWSWWQDRAGRLRLHALYGRNAAAGFGAQANDLFSLLPSYDLERHRALLQWEVDVVAADVFKGWHKAAPFDRPSRLNHAAPSEVGDAITRFRPFAERWRILCRNVSVNAGLAGNLADVSRYTPWVPFAWDRQSRTKAQRTLSLYLCLCALADPNEVTALDDAARQIETMRPTVTLSDAKVVRMLAANRDQTMLDLALHGRLSAASCQRFLAEPAPHVADGANAVRGVRLLFLRNAGDACEADAQTAIAYGALRPISNGPSPWWNALREKTRSHRPVWDQFVLVNDYDLAIERDCRGEALTPLAAPTDLGFELECLVVGTEDIAAFVCADYRHRLTRLALRTLSWRDSAGAFPEDDAAWRHLLADDSLWRGTRSGPLVHYSRVNDHAFRLHAVPSDSFWCDPACLHVGCIAGAVANDPAPWSLEISLPAEGVEANPP